MNGGRKKWLAESRPTDDGRPIVRRDQHRPRRSSDFSNRAFRDDVLEQVDVGRRAGRRPLARPSTAASCWRPAALPQEGAQRGGHIPGAANIPWATAVKRGRHVQGGRGAAAICTARRASRRTRTSSPTAASASARATPGSCCTSCSASSGAQLRRLLDRVGQPRRRPDREVRARGRFRLRALTACAGPYHRAKGRNGSSFRRPLVEHQARRRLLAVVASMAIFQGIAVEAMAAGPRRRRAVRGTVVGDVQPDAPRLRPGAFSAGPREREARRAGTPEAEHGQPGAARPAATRSSRRRVSGPAGAARVRRPPPARRPQWPRWRAASRCSTRAPPSSARTPRPGSSAARSSTAAARISSPTRISRRERASRPGMSPISSPANADWYWGATVSASIFQGRYMATLPTTPGRAAVARLAT